MIQRIKRFLNSREYRKLTRDWLTIASIWVIGAYLLTGVALMCGAITAETCDTVFGPNKLQGFYQVELPERRYEAATTKFIQKVQAALGQDDPATALSEVEVGLHRVADKSPAELQTLVDQALELKAELNTSENLDEDPAMLPKLEQLEAVVEEMKEPLTGWGRFVQNCALLLGTDSQGRSIFFRGIYSIKIALQIGLVTATFSVLLGAFLGAAAGYFGGWVDHAVVWIYTTFSSIPNLVLLVVIAFAFQDLNVANFLPAFMGGWASGLDLKNSLLPVYIAFGATFWIGTCRVIRGETLKLKQMEYVHAAYTAGFGGIHILMKHVLPNTIHLMLINFSLLLIGAIKSEVILSFLGLGVKGQPSWGIMIRDAGNNGDVVTGFFWEIGTATALMFVLVLAFNILSDALQDAFDPKHV